MTEYKSFELVFVSYQRAPDAEIRAAGIDGEYGLMDMVEFKIRTALGEIDFKDTVGMVKYHGYPHKLKHRFEGRIEEFEEIFDGDVPWWDLYDAMRREIDTFMDKLLHPERYHKFTKELLPEDQWGKHEFAGEPRKSCD